MTNKLLQAAQAALDALVQIDRVAPGPLGRNAMRVLREAIEQAEPEPTISTEHGPWVESNHPGEEGETYCKRCRLRDKFLGKRQCDPHIVYSGKVAIEQAGEHSFFDTAETIEQALERNPIGCLSNCTTCKYNQASEIPSHGWCYMFRHDPQGVCKKHTGYTHPAQAQPAKPLTAEQVFKAIEHGDTEHRAWLRAALYALWDGLPVPAQYDQQALELCTGCGWKTLIPGDGCLNCERKTQSSNESAYQRGYMDGRAVQSAKPLTDDQIGLAWSVANGEHNASAATKHRITRAIEAVHGIGVKP